MPAPDFSSPSVRVLVGAALRTVVLVAAVESVVWLYRMTGSDDDGLGTGLSVMLVLVCAAALWGLWDGLRQGPVRIAVTWTTVAAAVSLASTAHGPRTWGDLVFWAALVLVPALATGLLASLTRISAESQMVSSDQPVRR